MDQEEAQSLIENLSKKFPEFKDFVHLDTFFQDIRVDFQKPAKQLSSRELAFTLFVNEGEKSDVSKQSLRNAINEWNKRQAMIWARQQLNLESTKTSKTPKNVQKHPKGLISKAKKVLRL